MSVRKGNLYDRKCASEIRRGIQREVTGCHGTAESKIYNKSLKYKEELIWNKRDILI